MKFCPVVPEICRGQVHGAWKERRRIRIIIIKTRYDLCLGVQRGWGLLLNPMGNLKFRTLMLITSNWIMIET
jgi:hypothetical protein